MSDTTITAAESVAAAFHETYERLAPDYSYETREASAKPWHEVPENNRALMTAVVAELLTNGTIVSPALPGLFPRAALVEIVERYTGDDPADTGHGVTVPTELRLNGVPLLITEDGPIIHQTRIGAGEPARVTMTVFARRVVIGTEPAVAAQ